MEPSWHKCERCSKPVWATIDRWPIVLCEKCAMRGAVLDLLGRYGRVSLFWIMGVAGLMVGLIVGRHFFVR